MADPAATEFFRRQLAEDSWNNFCCDCNTIEPQWASISHGIYISIGASGAHRSLGVKISSVQSLSMDAWRPVHLRMMELGGNRRFINFLEEHGVPRDMPIRQKYRTRAAEWYRENLRAQAENRTLPPPLPLGTGQLLVSGNPCPTELLLDKVFAEVPHDIMICRMHPMQVETGFCKGDDQVAKSGHVPNSDHQSHWSVLLSVVGLKCLRGSACNKSVRTHKLPDCGQHRLLDHF